ncbi:protein of unknown function [Taphrina deformans PYCC 5710]|uniref:Uncharacterized protein n=1 Tax=Taphrina deformans (strain PYCC 5710 / ATCC 11124 / CBS 356.35 / IMI 108563 / JCM 9778 / NBRC 8474) TaxID=1097556 RepID=R4XGA8_TAPDE|nr:protein of unknown function [Taphrina deformans PYCC 5710]|eukprot:CCG84937.1 protein of unknown function [Taphrina deformans PYCC 5710]
MMHISLRDPAGKAIVQITNMSSGGGWLGALKSVATRKHIVAVKAGAAQSREERQVHSITKHGALTIWEVARGGNYRVVLDCDLWNLLSEEQVSEVFDVVAYPITSNSVLILAKAVIGATVLLNVQFNSDAQPNTLKRIVLPDLVNPKIHLPNPGHLAFVQTRNSVHLVSIATERCEVIRFHQEIDIVATGIEDQFKNKRNPGLILLTSGAGVLRIEIFNSSAGSKNPTGSKLEQAVFYGSLPDNPIDFTPPPSDLDIVARELSLRVLDGHSPFLQKSVSLKDHLQLRVNILHNLMGYAGPVLKPITLQVLREHMERLMAGQTLWTSVDARVERSSIIKDLIPRSAGQASNTDIVRTFFLHNLSGIDSVIYGAHRACIEAAAVLDSQPLSRVVLETNEIILAILMTATRFRDEHPEYGNLGDKWTSAADILQSTTVQLSISQKLRSGLREDDGDQLSTQLVGLTSLNCRLHEDFLAASNPVSAEHQALSQRYNKSRSQWLKDLVSIGQTDKALEIGEKYKAFQSLIEICHDQGESAKDEDVINTVVRRLEWYLHTFGYEFAVVLWEYYIAHRQFWNLLHEFPNYREYLTRFFEDGRYPSISWMNDVLLKDFDRAGQTLLKVAETRIEKRKIQLSIAKLALLVDNDEVPSNVEDQIQASLVLNSVSAALTEIARDAIDTTAAIDICAAQDIPRTMRNPDRGLLLRRHVTKFLQGLIPELGETIDYLTSRANPNFFDALRLLHYATVPDAVDLFLSQLIWRRCFIADDWPRLVNTTGQSDATVEGRTMQTHLYRTMRQCYKHDLVPAMDLKLPKDVYFEERQVVPFPGLSTKELVNLKKEYATENEVLDGYEAGADLASWHARIRRAAQTDVLNDREADEDEYVRVDHEDGDEVMEEEG